MRSAINCVTLLRMHSRVIDADSVAGFTRRVTLKNELKLNLAQDVPRYLMEEEKTNFAAYA